MYVHSTLHLGFQVKDSYKPEMEGPREYFRADDSLHIYLSHNLTIILDDNTIVCYCITAVR